MGYKEKVNYLKNYITQNNLSPHIKDKPADGLKIIVVIPAYNEDKLFDTLKSIHDCEPTNCDVEVIIVLNSSDEENEEVLKLHKEIKENFAKWSLELNKEKLKFFLINKEFIPRKEIGVGYARKVGMDEACLRFLVSGNYDGSIVSLDADCTVSRNYLKEIENLFSNNKIIGCNIRFEHEVEGENFGKDIYNAIIQYELYLHYFVIALKYIGYPYYYHTIGSAFAVRAYIYAQQGGMNKKQGGEDFYFLQKLFPLENFKVIKNAIVYPSPRLSFRVPFGTGITLNKIIKQSNNRYYVYNFKAFNDLKSFFDCVDNIFYEQNFLFVNKLSESLVMFLKTNEYEERLNEILKNTASINTFKKRFFRWFNTFLIIKFLNESHKYYYQKQYILESMKNLLSSLSLKPPINDSLSLLKYVRNYVYEKLY
ncbi:MAG: glycosyltransferase family 2 protein [Bacteroidales bacterium]|nr:glycosyltransferase family 2 protein [Bacteroidales bacterium]